MTIIRLFFKSFVILLCTVMIPLYGYLGYMKFIYTPPPPVPCAQGMTLQPGQSCYGAFVVVQSDHS